MLTAIAGAGYPAQDSAGNFDLQGYEIMDSFCTAAAYSAEDTSGTYMIVYPDGHISAFMLSRTDGVWHLYSTSAAWNEDGTTRIYSEGRYAVGNVRYTSKGWLIYTRDTSDFDENQRSNTDAYVMIRVMPLSAEAKMLCQRYVEPDTLKITFSSPTGMNRTLLPLTSTAFTPIFLPCITAPRCSPPTTPVPTTTR